MGNDTELFELELGEERGQKYPDGPEFRGALRAAVENLGRQRAGQPGYDFFVLYPAGATGAEQFLQVAGNPLWMTLEVKLPVPGGFEIRKVGHGGPVDEEESTSVQMGSTSLPLRPSEVLEGNEVFSLIEHYVEHGGIAPGWAGRTVLAFDETGSAG